MSMEPWDHDEKGTLGIETGMRAISSGVTISDVQGIAPHRRKSVEEAVIAGCSNLSANYEAWVVAARKPPGYAVRIIGPRGFYREVKFAGGEPEAEIEARIRQTLDGHA